MKDRLINSISTEKTPLYQRGIEQISAFKLPQKGGRKDRFSLELENFLRKPQLKKLRKFIEKKYIWILVFILVFHALVLAKLVFFPYPELFIYPYLTNHGLIPYSQILDQHFPGLLFLPINFGTLGMTNVFVARAWLIASVLITQLLLFGVVFKISKDPKKALLTNLLFLIWNPFLEGWVLWIDSFMAILFLPAFYLFYQFITQNTKKYSYVFWMGFLMSLAVLMKQTALPLAGGVFLMLLYYDRKLKTVLLYALGFLPLLVATTLYFYSKGAISDVWFWTITFNLSTYAKTGRIPPTFSQLVRVVGIYSPVVLVWVIRDKKLTISLTLFFLGALIGVSDRFDFVHFQPSLPFVTIITSFVLVWFSKKKGQFVLPVIYFVVVIVWLGAFYKGNISHKVFFFDSQTLQIAEKIKQNTYPGEQVFLLGPVPHLYFLSNTLPVGNIFVFQFPWFLAESQGRFLQVLQSDKPALVVRDNSVVIDGIPITTFAKKLDTYIDSNYVTFDRIGSTEFMHPKQLDSQ